MVLTETTQKAGTRETGHRHLVKRAEVLNFDPSGVEKVVATLRTDLVRKKSFIYDNRSPTKNHVIKVYGSLRSVIPAAIADTPLKEIYSTTVNAATVSDPMVFEGDYYWMVFTSNGDAESDVADLYYMGSKD